MLPTLFNIFVLVMAAVVVALVNRYASRRAAAMTAAGLACWLIYVAAITGSGLASRLTRPPGMLLVAGPMIVFVLIFVARQYAARRRATAVPLQILIATQVFRVGVELFLHAMWHAGVIPKTLTYSGANVDIYIGLTAPLVALFASRGRIGRQIALVWNVLGLLALANVVARAVMTAPGPLHLIDAEVPNEMFVTFPFALVPGFFVPLAVGLHTLSFRAIAARRNFAGGE